MTVTVHNEELFGFLGAHFGRLLNVRIHELGEPCSIDGILVNRIEFGKDPTEHCSHHVGRQPGDAFSLYEPLGERRLAHPGWTTDKVKHAAGHGCHCRSTAFGAECRSLYRSGLWPASLNRSARGTRPEQKEACRPPTDPESGPAANRLPRGGTRTQMAWSAIGE